MTDNTPNADTDTFLGFTADILNNAPADSYLGRERDLADLLSHSTLDAIDNALAADEFAAYTIFILMMMNEDAAVALTHQRRTELRALIALIQDDARDDSSEPFQARVAQRITARNTLIKLASGFPPADIS